MYKNIFLILILILSLGLVSVSGWHIANEIYPGTFASGDFSFDGNVNNQFR